MKELRDIIRSWQTRRGKPHALATLVHAQGSSYRRPGARMLIGPDRTIVGSLSGGCLEEEVSARAQEVMRSGVPSLMEFDTRRRFGCHGTIQIFVEVVRDCFLGEIGDNFEKRKACRAVTIFASDAGESGSRLAAEFETLPAGAFVQEIPPPLRLIIFGEGPDSAPLQSLGDLLGWQIVEAVTVADLPVDADQWTAAIVKSHNYGRDCAALRQLLKLQLPYVGLLGPRRRRDEILGDLLDSGVVIAADFFGPAGLDLGAETPEEIAVAIVAEIQNVMARASGESLRERKAPIHSSNVAPAAQV